MILIKIHGFLEYFALFLIIYAILATMLASYKLYYEPPIYRCPYCNQEIKIDKKCNEIKCPNCGRIFIIQKI